MKRVVLGLVVAMLASMAHANVLNMGGTRNADGSWNGLASLEMVTVGNPGNAADMRYATPGYGAVDYVYAIGRYEVTNAQWRELLNAKATVGDPYGLYHPSMAERTGGIARGGSGTVADPYVYTAKDGDANWDNRPVNLVSFWDAVRFCNWLHNGQGNGDTESGAYINIGNQTTFARQADAKWWIPSEDEWYKAAYHKNDGATGNYWDYPTGTNAVPSNQLLDPDPGNNANFNRYTSDGRYYTTLVGEFENSESPYGTFDQGGNLWEWNETAIGSSRGLRGSSWRNDLSKYLHGAYRNGLDPADEGSLIGFRVATVPEPSTLALLAAGVIALLAWGRGRGQLNTSNSTV